MGCGCGKAFAKKKLVTCCVCFKKFGHNDLRRWGNKAICAKCLNARRAKK